VNSGLEMVEAKNVSGKNIYWSTFIGKSKERKFFDFLHCPFEPPAKQHWPVGQLGWILWCMLAWPSKGQCRNSKNFPPVFSCQSRPKYIFFQRHVLPLPFLSLNSWCEEFEIYNTFLFDKTERKFLVLEQHVFIIMIGRRTFLIRKTHLQTHFKSTDSF
jgi:hypothetical protein